MIISEKQIIELITICSHFMDHILKCGDYGSAASHIAKLLDEINAQQSTELKQVE